MKSLMSLFAIVSLLIPTGALSADEGDGYIFYPRYFAGESGTVPPLHVADAETGEQMELRSVKATLSAGNQYAVKPGLYHVEVGQFRSSGNRRLYRVEKGKITTLETGTVTVLFSVPAEELEICPGWSQNITIYALHEGKFVSVAADVSMETTRSGAVQLHRGKYLLEWNKLHVPITIKKGKKLEIRPVRVAPFEGFSKPRLEEKLIDGLEKPGAVIPCPHKPLYLFPGDYILTFRVKTNSYPFYKKASQSTTIGRKKNFLRYKDLPRTKGKGKRYKGRKGVGEPVPADTLKKDEGTDATPDSAKESPTH